MDKFLPFNAPGFGNLNLPLDCDLVLLIPESHQMAEKDGQKIEVRIQVEKYLGNDSSGILFNPQELAKATDLAVEKGGEEVRWGVVWAIVSDKNRNCKKMWQGYSFQKPNDI